MQRVPHTPRPRDGDHDRPEPRAAHPPVPVAPLARVGARLLALVVMAVVLAAILLIA